MKAMVLNEITRVPENQTPLESATLPDPEPKSNEILVEVRICGVCHTELDEIEGRTPPPNLPIVPGHQVVGIVADTGSAASVFRVGDRVGVAWIYSACGECKYCLAGVENLCPDFKATGRDANGGYAQYMTVSEAYAYKIPESLSDSEAAPLLCAGAVGYRAFKLTNLQDGQKLGLTGFGGSGHLVLKLSKHKFPNSRVYVFARNPKEQAFARELGADWAGDTAADPPDNLDAIIDTTPLWKPIVEALRNLEPGGRLVINAIRKEDVDKEYLLKLNYQTHLWMEKEIKSVADVTRPDVREFLALAAEMDIKPEYQEFALEEANDALVELKTRKIRGAKVLRIS
jgi:propanol-preferring alcohol dehydrogenase